MPVYQDSSRDISNFSTASGTSNAKSALQFAQTLSQPEGSTIFFAVDKDYDFEAIDGPILDYFRAVKKMVGPAFSIGAYGSGAVLAKLLHEGLINMPWLSMSRLFQGTQSFFYDNRWVLRQLPPDQQFMPGSVGYDRNILRFSPSQLGAFTVDVDGKGHIAGGSVLSHILPVSIPFSVPTSPATRIVATDDLRLRDKPEGTIIRSLTIGEGVADLGNSGIPGWEHVKVGNDEGVVFDRYLRDQARPAAEALVQGAIAEWVRFEKGGGNENLAPFYRYVREMWASIGEPYDGRSRYPNGEEVPWSAAFISWVVRNAGPAYKNFIFAERHSIFVNNSIKARYTQRQDKPFWGYRIDEEKPALGDIIQKNWPETDYTFSWAENHEKYNSHSDIVVEVKPDIVRVIGGNVSDSVNMKEYRLDKDGYLKEGQKIIALLKNRADDVKFEGEA